MARKDQTRKTIESKVSTEAKSVTMAKYARKPMQNLKCFTLFPKLPAELRLMVWSFAANIPRTVDMQCPSYAHPALWTTSPQPSILKVNIEARREALKHYSVLLTPSDVPLVKAPCLYFNFIADTIPLSLSESGGWPTRTSLATTAIHPGWLYEVVARSDLARVQSYTIPEPESTNRGGFKFLEYELRFVQYFARLYFTSTRLAELTFTQKRTRRSNSKTQLEVFAAMIHFYTIVSACGKYDPDRPSGEPNLVVQGLEEETANIIVEYMRANLIRES